MINRSSSSRAKGGNANSNQALSSNKQGIFHDQNSKEMPIMSSFKNYQN